MQTLNNPTVRLLDQESWERSKPPDEDQKPNERKEKEGQLSKRSRALFVLVALAISAIVYLSVTKSQEQLGQGEASHQVSLHRTPGSPHSHPVDVTLPLISNDATIPDIYDRLLDIPSTLSMPYDGSLALGTGVSYDNYKKTLANPFE
jgi:hypothetical protein